jgi:hypothetical protein
MRVLGDLDLDVGLLLLVSDGSPIVAEATVVPEFNDVSMVQGITMVNRCCGTIPFWHEFCFRFEVPKKVAEGCVRGGRKVHFANWESSPQM